MAQTLASSSWIWLRAIVTLFFPMVIKRTAKIERSYIRCQKQTFSDIVSLTLRRWKNLWH
jgi:hypothetical protein